MSQFTVTWVGDQAKDWGEDRRGYTISVKDANGVETRKVKLDRARTAPAPAVGDVLEGSLGPHPRFNDASLFKEGAGAESKGEGASAPAASDPERQASIEAQTAAKAAGEALAGTANPTADHFAKLTKAGFQAIQDCKAYAARGAQQAAAPAPQEAPQEAPAQGNGAAPQPAGQTSTDDDIPF